MSDSRFYVAAYEALRQECRKLCDFTDALDKTPAEKAKQIGEYKCAKYRYASISLIQATLQNNNRFRKIRNLKNSCYLLPHFYDILKRRADYVSVYESTPEDERPDCGLYYALTALADEKTEELSSKLPLASDWEKIELEERISGFLTAKQCLDTAWAKRKDTI